MATHEAAVLIAWVRLVDRISAPDRGARRGRGRPQTYSARLFLKALVIVVVRRVSPVHLLLAMLAQPTREMAALRALLTDDGRHPTRRTRGRRLAGTPDGLSAQIGCLGRALVRQLAPWPEGGRAAAIDSTVLTACGGVWHGWVYGWKLHLVVPVARGWRPATATLTPAHRADNEEAPQVLAELPEEVRWLLGDLRYNDPARRERWEADGRTLVTTRHARYPHQDDGAPVRRVFHQIRSRAIETFNEQFKAIFDPHGPVPTRRLVATRRFVRGAVLVYQLLLRYRHERGDDLRVGLKACLRAA